MRNWIPYLCLPLDILRKLMISESEAAMKVLAEEGPINVTYVQFTQRYPA